VISKWWADLKGDFLGTNFDITGAPEFDSAIEFYEWLTSADDTQTTPLVEGGGLTLEEAYDQLIFDTGNGYPYFDDRCYAQVTSQKNCEYDVIGITDTICEIEGVTVFALDTIKTMVGAEGTNVAVCRLYSLEDYGIIHDAICIQPCGAEGYQWRLDIVQAGIWDIEYGDDSVAGTYYSSTIYDDWIGNDIAAGVYAPDFRDGAFEAFISLKLMNLIDIRVCGSAQTIPLCCWEMPKCGIDDFWVNTGDAPVYIELTIDDAGDLSHTNLIVEGGFAITHYAGETTTTEIQLVDIDPMSIVVNDDEVTDTMKASSNLVLVGGPGLVVCVGAEPQVANTLTQELVDQGLSTVNWVTSIGEYEYIANAFADGKDIVIVAGADREATRHAVENLLNDLNA